VSFQVLEHVPVPNDYLKEAHRVTKSGGKLFLTTHGQWPYHPTPTDYHRWTKAGLILELERAGFAVRSVTPVLNEFSAAVQNFVMNGEYRGYWRNYCRPVHWLAHCLIRFLESRYRYEPDIPAILCIKGEKR
jgi:ubiquinone/menaquinone biosynthesis C-methylase UbiE